MNKILTLTLVVLTFVACKKEKAKNKLAPKEVLAYSEFTTPDYQLYVPNTTPKAVLVLFGGYPETTVDIKREFRILEKAKKHKIALVFSNYNKKLWLEQHELKELAKQLQEVFIEYKLPNENLYVGGFSSGGNVSLLIGDYLTENKNFKLIPKGIFIVDSPIDLTALYVSAEKNIKRGFSEVSVQEGNFIIKMLNDRFGNPNKDLKKYEEYAVFTAKTKNIEHLKNLKNTKIRMYTEPDTLWWKKNRMADYDQMNAYYIKKLSEQLQNQGFENVEYIPTKDRVIGQMEKGTHIAGQSLNQTT